MKPNVDILKGMSYNSSLSDIDATVSFEEYKGRLISSLQDILNRTFPENRVKQQIREYKDRINFSCPYCGDSVKNHYKKRGNFILIGKYAGYFKCHNCGIAKRIDLFFNDFKVNLDLNTINYISSIIKDFDFKNNTIDMSIFFDIDKIESYAIDRQEFLKYFGLKEIKGTSIEPWLRYRLQYDDKKFLYNLKENYLVILNLTPSGKILGAQKRLFKGNSKYKTLKLSYIYTKMKKDEKIIPDEIDRISQYFNICLLNYSKPITLFEGPLDAFLFKNAVANAGANKDFPFDIKYRLFYDYDETGIKRSIDKINQGFEVFLFGKFLKDINAPYRKKWDLNDILIWAKQNNVKLPNFDDYFSNDPLSIIDI